MGFVPPRPQHPGETNAEYIAYLEGLLVSRRRAQAMSIVIGLAVAAVILIIYTVHGL